MEAKNQHTVFLVMDIQIGIVKRLTDSKSFINRAAKAIALARKKQIPVLYVVVGFRPGLPELSDNNKSFAAAKEQYAKINMDEFMTIHPDLSKHPDEITVVKKRLSAFSGSDLEMLLRAKDIQHLILTGISTSGVLLSTIREAADKDFRITVLSDCCADQDEEVHRILMTKIFPRQADVTTLDEWEKL
ncbi:MAG: cysteine hydrolase [Bacteroidetes bacterium]|nr:cysteine hydrolase [Bacteroidota bacterium]